MEYIALILIIVLYTIVEIKKYPPILQDNGYFFRKQQGITGTGNALLYIHYTLRNGFMSMGRASP